MIIKLKLTEDMLKVISEIRFDRFKFTEMDSPYGRIVTDTMHEANELMELYEENAPKGENPDFYYKKNKFYQKTKQLVEQTDILYQETKNNDRYGWGIDSYGVYGGTYLLEDISRIIGIYDKHIKGTEEDPEGVDFPKDLKEYMWEMHEYITSNLVYIENLVHYYITRGGLTAGTYKCKSNEMIWEKVKKTN